MSESARDMTIIHREIDDFRRRISVLQAHVDRGACDQGPIVSALLEELHVAVAELLANEEELRLQHQQWGEIQERMRQERLRYQDLFDHAPDAYLVTSTVGVIQQVNVPAAAMLQRSKDSLLGKPLLVFVGEEHKRIYLDRLAQLVTSACPSVRGWELMLQPGAATGLSAIVNVTAQRDSRNEVVALRWSIREVSPPS